MDETVIKAIGEQLGLATDNAAQFIQTYLPQYANLKVMLDITACIISGVVFLMFLIAFLIVFKIYSKREKDPDITNWDNEGWETATFIIGGLTVIAFIAFTIICFAKIPDAIAWSQFPEAQLINEAIKAIKGQ